MYRLTFALIFSVFSFASQAEQWRSMTLDNDVFIGQDDGYTNGLYIAQHEVGAGKNSPSHGFLMRHFSKFIASDADFSINSYTLGQTMMTPEDITVEQPDPNDIPYSGMLFLSNTHISGHENVADKFGFTIGIVGPASMAEQSQKIVHEIIDGQEPMGWVYQLKNELVFQFDRGRIWRKWLGETAQNADFVFLTDLSIGTIETSVSSSVFLRFGQNLRYTYVTPSLHSNRTSNPIAVGGGWFAYVGLRAKYLARQIFIDGNTFRDDSPSADLDHSQFSLSLGATYSWKDYSVSFALENSHVFEEAPEAVSRYGSLTFAWRR